MNPKTKYQAKVYALSLRVKPLSKRETRWIQKDCFSHFAYRLKNGQAVCMECGQTIGKIDSKTELVQCPHCKAHLQVKTTRKRLYANMLYTSVMTTMENFQVERVFLARQYLHKGQKAHYHIKEIVQRWLDTKGRITYIGLMRSASYYIDNWIYNSELEIRKTSLWVYEQIAQQSDCYPKEKILPILERNGYAPNTIISNRIKLCQALLINPKIETLVKCGQYEVVNYFLKRGTEYLEPYWRSLRIAMKHGYIIADIGLWRDMIDLLKWFGKDTNCPKYICPNNLKAEHDRLANKRKRIIDERRAREMERERLEKEADRRKNKEDFYSLKQKFFGLKFTDKNITICVLESIEEFKEEGTKLHHCVYANEYYAKKESLILSARIDNEPIETIEVSLDTMSIVQSRGLCNQNSPYHDEIVQLVNSNLSQIAQRMIA